MSPGVVGTTPSVVWRWGEGARGDEASASMKRCVYVEGKGRRGLREGEVERARHPGRTQTGRGVDGRLADALAVPFWGRRRKEQSWADAALGFPRLASARGNLAKTPPTAPHCRCEARTPPARREPCSPARPHRHIPARNGATGLPTLPRSSRVRDFIVCFKTVSASRRDGVEFKAVFKVLRLKSAGRSRSHGGRSRGPSACPRVEEWKNTDRASAESGQRGRAR